MNHRRKFRVLIAAVALFVNLGGTFGQKIFKEWPLGSEPAVIGGYVANHYVASGYEKSGPADAPAFINAPESMTWYGALQVAKAANNKDLSEKLRLRFEPLLAQSSHLVPAGDSAEQSVFGAVPIELGLLTNQNRYVDVGKVFADKQWELPESPKPEQQVLHGRGLSWQTKMTPDNLFLITLLQVQAFRATGTVEYIARAANEMTVFLDALQQGSGLFYQATDVPIYFSRGNGYAAASMALVLTYLPLDNPNRPQILASYKKMMTALKQYMDVDYRWHVVMDEDKAFAESSGSAMCTYALIQGVKKKWLEEPEWGIMARNCWMAVVKTINEAGDMKDVCEETPRKNDKQYYMNREKVSNTLIGQGPVMWCAAALLDIK